MYTLVLFHILAWNQIAEVDATGPFEKLEQCQTAMYIGAKLLEQRDPGLKYFLLCRKS